MLERHGANGWRATPQSIQPLRYPMRTTGKRGTLNIYTVGSERCILNVSGKLLDSRNASQSTQKSRRKIARPGAIASGGVQEQSTFLR
jgi:hypothetical protein